MFVLLLTVFVDLVGFGIVFPLLPFIAQSFGASPQRVMLLIVAYAAMQFLAAPLWGRLSDRHGRRRVLLATLMLVGLGHVWFGLSESLLSLFLARAFSGAMAGNIAVAQAYIADLTAPEKRAEAMGRLGAAFGLGFVVGPALGGTLLDWSGAFVVPCLTAAALSFLAALLGVIVLKEPAVRKGMARPGGPLDALRLAGQGRLITYLVLLFAMMLVFSQAFAILPLWLAARLGWSPSQVGYAIALTGLLVAVTQGTAVGPLTRWLGERRLYLLGAALLAAGLAGIPWADGTGMLLLQILLMCGGHSLCMPSLTSLISSAAQGGNQGVTLGVSQSAAAAGRVLGPLVAGYAFENLGHDLPFFIGAALMLPVLAQALAMAWRRR